MTREEAINQESKKHKVSTCVDGVHFSSSEQFEEGVEWAEERHRELWQSATCRPTRNQVIITQDTDGAYNVVSTSAVIPPTLKAREEWDRFVYINRIATWAYIDSIVKLSQK